MIIMTKKTLQQIKEDEELVYYNLKTATQNLKDKINELEVDNVGIDKYYDIYDEITDIKKLADELLITKTFHNRFEKYISDLDD